MSFLRQGGRLRHCVLAAVLWWAWPAIAVAQQAPALRPGHFTLGAAVVRAGTYDIGDATAQLTGNAPGVSPPPFTLFQARSRLTAATLPEFTLGFAFTRRLALEAGASLSSPRVAVAISGDQEAPAQELPGEQLEQYQFEAALTWQVPMRIHRRIAPFAIVGGGYLRQLHEGRTVVETGEVYFAGAGARYWLRGASGRSLAFGIRGDARLNVRRRGIDFENLTRSYPSLSLGVFLGL